MMRIEWIVVALFATAIIIKYVVIQYQERQAISQASKLARRFREEILPNYDPIGPDDEDEEEEFDDEEENG